MFSEDIESVLAALKQSPEQMDARDSWSLLSPLENAAKNGRHTIVSTLLSAGASPGSQYGDSPCALHLAVIYACLKNSKSVGAEAFAGERTLSALVDSGSSPIQGYVDATCSCKSSSYDIQKASFSMERGVALHIAAAANNVKVVKFLLQKAFANPLAKARRIEVIALSGEKRIFADATAYDIAEYLGYSLVALALQQAAPTPSTPCSAAHTVLFSGQNPSNIPVPSPSVLDLESLAAMPWGVTVPTPTGPKEAHKRELLLEYLCQNPDNALGYAMLAKDLPVGKQVFIPHLDSAEVDSVRLALKAIELDDCNVDAFRVLAASCIGGRHIALL